MSFLEVTGEPGKSRMAAGGSVDRLESRSYQLMT
jgi:hypothetical protein